MSTNDDDRLVEIAHAQRELAMLSYRLRRTGLFALLATLANLVAVVFGLAWRPYVYYDVEPLLVALPVGFGLLALVMLILFDLVRRRGEAVYAEISDEMQYWLSQSSSDASEDLRRPPMEIRMAMRQFVSATQLPLVPGRAGPAALAAVNLAIMLLVPLALAF